MALTLRSRAPIAALCLRPAGTLHRRLRLTPPVPTRKTGEGIPRGSHAPGMNEDFAALDRTDKPTLIQIPYTRGLLREPVPPCRPDRRSRLLR